MISKRKFQIFSTFIFLLSFFLSGDIQIADAQSTLDINKVEYKLLAPLPLGVGFTEVKETNPVAYIPGLIRLIIGLAGALAVVMIIIGGFQYISSDGFGKTSNAKEKIQNALLGLLLVIGSYSILYTLNPKLVNLNLSLQTQKIGGDFETHLGTTTQPGSIPKEGEGCSGCVYVTAADFPQKPPGEGCALTLPEKKCQVAAGLVPKLHSLGIGMLKTGLRWQVNEMFPPTVTHKSTCHMITGTCVDAGIELTSHENIKTFLIEINRQFGNRYIYEVSNDARLKELQSDPNLSAFKNFFKNTGNGEHAHIVL
jgi:hypothetical protein